MVTIAPEARTAPASERVSTGGVTLMNGFVVAPELDDDFHAVWYETSRYFIQQPGFIATRLHRALTPGAPHRWINVAFWETEADFRNACSTDEFRRLVSQDKWQQFASVPLLFEVVEAVGQVP